MQFGGCSRALFSLRFVCLLLLFIDNQHPTMSAPQRDTLWKQVKETTEKAISVGALSSLNTRIEFVQDGGVEWFVRVVESLNKKPTNLAGMCPQSQTHRNTRKHTHANTLAHNTQHTGAGNNTKSPSFNPFLPYDPNLYVTTIYKTHNILLNKFNVAQVCCVLTFVHVWCLFA